MGQTDQGITQLRLLVKQFPNSVWAEYAKDRLREHHALDEPVLSGNEENIRQ